MHTKGVMVLILTMYVLASSVQSASCLKIDPHHDVQDVKAFLQVTAAGVDTHHDAEDSTSLLQVTTQPHLGAVNETFHVRADADSTSLAFLSDRLRGIVSVLTSHWILMCCTVCLCCFIGRRIYRDHQDRSGEQLLQELVGVHGLSEAQSFWHDPFCVRDFRLKVLYAEAPRVALAILCWTFGLYGNNVSQAWLQRHMEGYYESRWKSNEPSNSSLILWDLAHALFPDSVVEPWLADVWAKTITIIVFFRFFVVPGPFSMRWTVLRRMLLIWGFLWGLRGILIVCTVLPNPEKSCKPRISFPDNLFREAWANMPFVFWKSELTCHDVVFSGHTTVMTLATLIYFHYADWTPWSQVLPSPEWLSSRSTSVLLKAALVINLLSGFFVIIVSKTHYTVDVLIGATVTILAFQAYHATLGIAFVPETKPALLSHGICPILPLIKWLEIDAVDVAVVNAARLQKHAEASS